MNFPCIAIDLEKRGYKKDLDEANLSPAIEIDFTSIKEFGQQLAKKHYAFLLVAADDYSNELETILNQFKDHCGAQTDKIFVICDKPSFKHKSNLFDYGICKLLSSEVWIEEFSADIKEISRNLTDKASSDYLCYVLYHYLREGKTKSIKKIAQMLEPFEAFDFFAAHHRSIALQAISDYKGSFASNNKALDLHPTYRPAMFEKLQNLIILNKPQKAYQEANRMTEMGSNSLQKKMFVIYINAELFKFEKAKEKLNELRGMISRANELELQLYLLFSQEKIETALSLIEKVPQIGPILFTKINSVGIKLSNEKKGDVALTIYKKIHAHVVKELKYKVSLNAAITAYKMTKFELAIKYAKRCEQELGEKNDKAEKIKQVSLKYLKQQRAG